MAESQDQARHSNIEAALREAIRAAQVKINTLEPGVIQSFDAATQRAKIQLGIKRKLAGDSLDIPLLLDVPIYYPRAGGFAFTFPVKAGDECLVLFGTRNMDNWLESGAQSEVADARLHAFSDAVAIVGGFSSPAAMADYHDDRVALREVGGPGAIEIHANGKFRLTNGTEEVIDLISQTQAKLAAFMDEVASLKTIVTRGSSANAAGYAHNKITAVNGLKSDVDNLKDKLDGLKP